MAREDEVEHQDRHDRERQGRQHRVPVGDELPDTSNDFACIRDNVTGLIWELKEPVIAVPPASTLRAANNRYSFVNSNAGNGDEAGVPAAALSTCPSAENCGLEVYVEEVNETAYCGGANLRFATLEELIYIADIGRVGENHLLDTTFFRFLSEIVVPSLKSASASAPVTCS